MTTDRKDDLQPRSWRQTYAQLHRPAIDPTRTQADREQRQYERGIEEGERVTMNRVVIATAQAFGITEDMARERITSAIGAIGRKGELPTTGADA